MPLFVPESLGATIVEMDRMKAVRDWLMLQIGDGEGSDAKSLKNSVVAMREAFAAAKVDTYWTGFAATASHERLDQLLKVLEASVEEFSTIVSELNTYIEVYEYVDAAAQAQADQGATDAAAATAAATGTEG